VARVSLCPDQGFFSFPDVKTAIWDIEAALASLDLPPYGLLIHDAEVILPGTKALAQQVAVEIKEAFNLDFSPSLADIMDAIQRGDFIYGTDRLDFSAIYQSACEKWVEAARAEIRSKWTQHLPQLGEVLWLVAVLTLPLQSAKHQAIASDCARASAFQHHRNGTSSRGRQWLIKHGLC
jgi:hypothetical protein